MSLADLLFVATFLLLAALLATSGILAVRRRYRPAWRSCAAALSIGAAYMTVFAAVSLSSRRVDLSIGTEQCFDDWCAAVTGAIRNPGSVDVNLAVRSKARRATFRPDHPKIHLIDLATEHLVAPASEDGPPLAQRLAPGDHFEKHYRFPANGVTEPAILVEEGTGPPLIIGAPDSLWHARTVTRL